MITFFKVIQNNFLVSVVWSTRSTSSSPTLIIMIHMDWIICNQIIINLSLLIAFLLVWTVQFPQMHFIIHKHIISLKILVESIWCISILVLWLNFRFPEKFLLRIFLNLIIELIFNLRCNPAVPRLFLILFEIILMFQILIDIFALKLS